MVYYCCVKGCNSNSKNKKKHPDSLLSFHTFPCKKDMRQKWLKAIGRPDWDPPSYTRICSIHFDFDQFHHDKSRTRVKDDAYPVNSLPLNSNFEASQLEVCRICLDTKRKMFSLRSGLLKTCLETITGFNNNCNLEGLPQYVCYICAALLKKCYSLIEKSMVAQTILLDIFAKYGQITKTLIIKQKDIEDTSPLTYEEQSTIYEIKYGDEENSIIINRDNKYEYKEESDLEFDSKEEIKIEYENETNEIIYDSDCGDSVINSEINDDSDDDKPLDLLSKQKPIYENDDIEYNNTRKGSNPLRLTKSELKMKKFFNIVKLTPEEQAEEWMKSCKRRCIGSEVYQCGICYKMYALESTLEVHMGRHDPVLGDAECPICKLRFKNEIVANSHVNRTHAKKFYCKLCPKAFINVRVSKKHHNRHAGQTYKCTFCSFESRHDAALAVHMRRQHADSQHACVLCGHAFVTAKGLRLHYTTAHGRLPEESEDSEAYRCEQCMINFASEGAKRVHLLTSIEHKRKGDLCDKSSVPSSLKNCCNKCGQEFPTTNDLVTHIRSEHSRLYKKTTWKMPDDKYPTGCEHCGKIVNNRKEHWRHVSLQHPKQRDTYKPVITVMCDTCGKGFQNSTKLHLHELRHKPPTVRCDVCPRTFYDKFGLARHMNIHFGKKPHLCKVCGRAFTLVGNLHRHSKVHSEATPYECSLCPKKFKYTTSRNLHIRTFHYKMPHPQSKRKSKKRRSPSLSDVDI